MFDWILYSGYNDCYNFLSKTIKIWRIPFRVSCIHLQSVEETAWSWVEKFQLYVVLFQLTAYGEWELSDWFK